MEPKSPLDWQKFVYPGILLCWLLFTVAVFIWTARSITQSINLVFSVNEAAVNAQLLHLNSEDYRVTAAKLGLPPLLEIAVPGAAVAPATNPTASSTATSSPALLPPATSSLKLAVYNGTTIPGQAAKVKKALELRGFTVAASGNYTERSVPQTEIRVKNSTNTIAWWLPTVQTELTALQLEPEVKTSLAASSTYDAVIIIGSR